MTISTNGNYSVEQASNVSFQQAQAIYGKPEPQATVKSVEGYVKYFVRPYGSLGIDDWRFVEQSTLEDWTDAGYQLGKRNPGSDKMIQLSRGFKPRKERQSPIPPYLKIGSMKFDKEKSYKLQFSRKSSTAKTTVDVLGESVLSKLKSLIQDGNRYFLANGGNGWQELTVRAIEIVIADKAKGTSEEIKAPDTSNGTNVIVHYLLSDDYVWSKVVVNGVELNTSKSTAEQQFKLIFGDDWQAKSFEHFGSKLVYSERSHLHPERHTDRPGHWMITKPISIPQYGDYIKAMRPDAKVSFVIYNAPVQEDKEATENHTKQTAIDSQKAMQLPPSKQADIPEPSKQVFSDKRKAAIQTMMQDGWDYAGALVATSTMK